MNGPEHYREAERLVGLVESGEWDDTGMPGMSAEVVAGLLAMAQAHATLALTAATAAAQATAYDGDERHHRTSGWAAVA